MFTVKKQLDSLRHKEVYKLQTVRHYLDKVENEEYQGVQLPGFTDAIAHLSEHATYFVNLLTDAMEARIYGGTDIASISSILNCEAWDYRSSGNESMDDSLATSKNPSNNTDSRNHSCRRSVNGMTCLTTQCKICHLLLAIIQRHGIRFSTLQELWNGKTFCC